MKELPAESSSSLLAVTPSWPKTSACEEANKKHGPHPPLEAHEAHRLRVSHLDDVVQRVRGEERAAQSTPSPPCVDAALSRQLAPAHVRRRVPKFTLMRAPYE